jgi:hypothetical protein
MGENMNKEPGKREAQVWVTRECASERDILRWEKEDQLAVHPLAIVFYTTLSSSEDASMSLHSPWHLCIAIVHEQHR